ncbi:hypothetical protein EH165_14770 [Nakamurella antarctica]|uniref:Uncharacterized protein n=1 Tax=Nakamurella antarctica TaxID=1902245 RepID=A0A3G8ZXS4_9ACTN|nr:hypothetical protein [Nakamurella antarctica]AZI59214.1 hypothetical protein EH165_14770 [Nakamurella antarctica]
MRDTSGVHYSGPTPFHGRVVWLTSSQGGRDTGPPPTPTGEVYIANAYVPPHSFETGLAGFVVRAEDPTAWLSVADASWSIVKNRGAQRVRPGTLLAIAEGRRVVGYFHVNSVD